jgi:hypothetical protein
MPSAEGRISGNAISTFLDDGTSGVACGIHLLGNAGADITIEDNTFPNPPGNEQDVCDFRT